MTIRDIAIAFGYELDPSSEKKVNNSINNLKSMATKALGAIGIGFSLSQANALIEQFKATNLQLKSVTGNLADQGKLQDDIMQKAASTRVSYATTAKAVSDYVSQSKKVLKTSDAALNFVELSTKAWKAAGKEESAIASLHGTLAKAFQKNIIDAGTFETLLSQSPETIKYLEKSLGKSRVQLKAMATAGVLTASHLTTAFTNSADEINAAYAETGVTISEAMQIAKDKIGLVLTQSDEGIKLTTTIAKAIIKITDYVIKLSKIAVNFVKDITDRLGGIENAMKLIGIAVAAFVSVQAIAKIKLLINAFKDLGKAAIIARLKVVAIIAAIAMIFLIIEDIVGFMNGKDSVFGDILKKMGLDPDEVRGSMISIVNGVKNGVRSIEDAFKGITNLGSKMKSFFEENRTLIGLLAIAMGTLTAAIVANNIAKKIELKGYAEGIALKALDKANTIGMTVATIAQTAASKIATVATTAFGVATQFLCSPITLVILAIGALIAGFYLLYRAYKKNEEKVNAWVGSVWEKVKSFFGKIIEWFKSNWPALLLLLVNPFLGGFMLLYNNSEKFRNFINNLLEKIKEKFGEMKEKLKNKVAEWKDGIVEGFEAVKTWFEDLPKRAWQWGKDMLKNFVDGIKGGKSDVEEAVGGVTEPIESNLHHSVPDEGPLKDDDKWMPDFISNIAGGIRKGLPKVRAAVQGIASELAVFASGAPTNVTQQMSQGATSTRIVNQYNNWTNNFNGGTKQEQADLADASDKQTTVASRKLGVELAYTR